MSVHYRKIAELVSMQGINLGNNEIKSLSNDEMRELVHELRAQQANLTQQKQELQAVRAELAKAKQECSLLYELAPIGYFTFDADGMILKVNSLGAKQLGIAKNYLEHKSFTTYLPSDSAAIFVAHVRKVVQDQEPHSCELTIKGKDGKEFEAQMQSIGIPDTNGMVNQIYATLNDLTASRKTENEIKQAKESAQIANQVKSTFLANMSHELRTPLNGILGYTQILKWDDTLIGEQRKGIDVIHHNGEYLLTLINDILDLSKIEAEQLEVIPTDFSLDDFLKNIVDLFQKRAEQKGIIFTYEISPVASPKTGEILFPLLENRNTERLPITIYADEARLRQIVINVLSNALKFTQKGNIALKVHYSHGKFCFQVKDTGIGIATDELEKIFLPFTQAGDPRYKPEGTGIGLYLTKKLVELMNGEIQVESVLNQGTTFIVKLNLPEIATAEEPNLPEKNVIIGFAGLPRKILLVDGKWENRSVLINLLKPLGFEIETANDGQECIDKVLISKPDVILIDLIMPVMDGFEATQKLRKMPQFKDIVIIAVSSSIFDFQKQQSLKAGCTDFITRPFEDEKLLKCLEKYLNLTWTYARKSPVIQFPPSLKEGMSDPHLDDTSIKGPSVAQAQVLFELTMSGNITGIQEYVKQLEQTDAMLQPFTQKIQRLADDLRIRQIRKVAKQYMDNLA